MKFRCKLFLMLSILPLLIGGGCRIYTQEDQEHIHALYYGNRLPEAARLAMSISDEEADSSGGNALIWHLEAGNTNYDAGEFENSQKALERAEKLLYYFDRDGNSDFHTPGELDYRGYRSDRIAVQMLKFLNYLQQDKLEDALVELRRMRVGQYFYLTESSDPNLRQGDGKGLPYYLRELNGQQEYAALLRGSGLQDELGEYRDRLRPQLPALFNPLAFYLSAWGYYWQNDYEEARIDLKYLQALSPANAVFRRDYATVLRLLGEPLPADLEKLPSWNHLPDDNTVMLLYAGGKAPAWKRRKTAVHLSGKVPADWSFSYPVGGDVGQYRVTFSAGKESQDAAPITDLATILTDEFWQLTLPRQLKQLKREIDTTTTAHIAAQANLARLRASGDFPGREAALAAAVAAVAATSRASFDRSDWRRWSTLPGEFRIAHLPIPANRLLTVEVRDVKGKPLFRQQLKVDADTYRGVIYLREIAGKFHLKFHQSTE